MSLATEAGFAIGNLDATIIAQRPKLAPYIREMVENVAAACAADPSKVNVKATTTEELGFEGRGEGISAHAVVLLSASAATS
jgi:2-C-methyl-D-erythritol 2,4-cyclodiphosphate synthase